MSKFLRILTICGACISFYIGAGFATMQEVAQYEASYGKRFPIVILVAAAIYIYTNISFATNGHRLSIEHGGDIYGAYCSICGKKFKKLAAAFFDGFSAIFCYMSFVVMCGGASSTVAQQWGMPIWVGAVVLSILVVITTICGLDSIVDVLSKIGPLIIVTILLVSVVTAFMGWNHFSVNIVAIDEGEYVNSIKQVGNNNPLYSGASYGGFVILWFAAFMAEIGAKNCLTEVNKGMLLSAVFIFGAATICCIALIGNVDTIAGTDIPALYLAQQISPVLAQVFAIIICAGIYTSATPLLWTGVRKVAHEGTARYIILTTIGGIAGCVIACWVPYQGLINVLYGINGYLGFLLVFFMIAYDVKTHMSKKNMTK